jgi:hypothetical protein
VSETAKTYNGWTNYETWLITMHLDNDEYNQDQVRRITRRASDVYDLENDLKDWVDAIIQPEEPDHSPQGLLRADLIGSALAEVCWREIADYYWSAYADQDDDDEDDDDQEDQEVGQ